MSQFEGDSTQDIQKILRRIHELEELVEQSRGLLGAVFVPEDEFFRRLTQLHRALPPCLKQACDTEQQVEEMRHSASLKVCEVLQAAEKRCDLITADAHQQQESIMAAARQQAGQTTAQASAEAKALVETARDTAITLTQQARQQAEQLLMEHPLFRQAKQIAQQRQLETRQEALQFCVQADQYAEELLEETALYLTHQTSSLNKALAVLSSDHHLAQEGSLCHNANS